MISRQIFFDVCAGRDALLSVAASKHDRQPWYPWLQTLCQAVSTRPHEPRRLGSCSPVGMVRLGRLRCGAPPRSDQHAELLANLEPSQLLDSQTKSLIHQNVIAILTAIHASGGHVLWLSPPSQRCDQFGLRAGFLVQQSYVLDMGGRLSVDVK